MKKTNKRNIVILIILIILIIVMLRVFIKSRANNVVEITANFKDNSGLLSDESISLNAVNEGESGYSITLPDIVNTKKISKYIITQKEIIENEVTEQESTNIEDATNTLSTENTNTVDTNETTTNTVTTDIVDTNGTDTNTTDIVSEEKTTSSGTTETTTETATDANSTVEKLPGEKIYLTQKELDNLQVTLTAQYDTIEVDTQILYNKKLIAKDEEDYEILYVSGYMPYDTEIELNEADFTNVENEIIENYPEASLWGSYDIKLLSNSKEYIAKDYGQTLDIGITINDESLKYNLLEMQNDTIQELKDFTIENGKIKFTVEELKSYLVLQENGIAMFAEEDTSDEQITNGGATTYSVGGEESKFEIDDYESDKNYYLGLNYTEGMSKTNSGKYTESNLKEVQINYYGYDYDLTEFVERGTYDVTLNATATARKGTLSGNRNNSARTDTITCIVSGINNLKQQYPDFKADSGWTLKMAVPNKNFSTYFNQTETDNANSSKGISVSVSNGIITVTGEDTTSLANSSGDACTFTFRVALRGTRNGLNATIYDALTVNSFKTTIKVGTPYGTISDTEQQMLVSYRKCVPVDSSGNITIELIDNPFMNRPLKKGFNGWKTNNTNYSSSISTNTNTFVQTLTTNINNITDSSGKYVIDLYVDWVDANVIFVSSSGSSSNDGTSPSKPIDNSWSSINSKLNSNVKTCTKASNREVNIVVLMNGTLDVSGLTGPSTPYTLTSLYDGNNYGSTNTTYLDVGTTNVRLDSDLQIDYLYVSSNVSYYSPSYGTITDGTDAVSPCLYGNMYNLRIGRGVVPTNDNYSTWAQVQGGYYNHSSSEYRLVIETGKYYTAQLYRAGSASTSTTANGTMVVGCDIDRINNNNENLRIYNRMASRTTSATANPYTANNAKAVAVNMIIKSGTIGVDYFKDASTADTSERNYAGIYVGGHGKTGYDKSDRYLLVEGGNIANIIGGLSMGQSDMFKTYMYVKGGNVINITGGAGYSETYGDRIIQVTGGYIKYSISGGSNGVAAGINTGTGDLRGESLIYVGGTAQIGASSTVDSNGNETVTVTSSNEVLYGVNAGSVCGGANGNDNYAGQTDSSYIIIDGNAIVHNNVFGGGNYGIIASTNVKIPDVLTFKDETSNFTENTEYLITTSSDGGNGLLASGTSLSNEEMVTTAEPNASSKWVFENYSGNQYYIKNASTGQYIYVKNVSSSWRYIYCKYNVKYN